jgi:hypothetical protein
LRVTARVAVPWNSPQTGSCSPPRYAAWSRAYGGIVRFELRSQGRTTMSGTPPFGLGPRDFRSRYDTTHPRNGHCSGCCCVSSMGMVPCGSPVVAYCIPWKFHGWVSDRGRVTRSMTRATFGSRSLTRRPGTAVGIEPMSPRTSAGASDFGSNVSSWLGPPNR